MFREEIENVVIGQQVNYEGIFDHDRLFRLIDNFFKKKGYTRYVVNDAESSTKNGRNINLKIRPYNQVKSSVKLEIQVFIKITNMVKTIHVVDEVPVEFDRGKISIVMDAFVISNLRGKFESRAEYYFIRSLFDKFLFRPEFGKYSGRVKKDLMELKKEIRSLLNLNKFLY